MAQRYLHSPRRVVEAAALIRQRVSNARDELILGNRILARKIGYSVLRKWGAQLPPDELQSAADLAVCEAARTWRRQKGAAFATWLYFYVSGVLADSIKMRAGMCAPQGSSWESLDEDRGEWERVGQRRETQAAASEAECPETRAYRRELRVILRKSFECLRHNERQILIRVHLHDQQVTVAARELGLSRGHAFELRKSALAKVRAQLDNFALAA